MSDLMLGSWLEPRLRNSRFVSPLKAPDSMLVNRLSCSRSNVRFVSPLKVSDSILLNPQSVMLYYARREEDAESAACRIQTRVAQRKSFTS